MSKIKIVSEIKIWIIARTFAQRSSPGESRERNTAIHHWVLLDIRKVVDSDEAMPDHLRINPKRHYRQTEQDEEVRSLECRSAAKWRRTSFLGYDRANSFSLLRCLPGHCGL